MELNLLPTFIMGEAGIKMRNKAKKHQDKSTKNDHATNDRETVLRICLYIDNSFSVFPSSEPTIEEIYDPIKDAVHKLQYVIAYSDTYACSKCVSTR